MPDDPTPPSLKRELPRLCARAGSWAAGVPAESQSTCSQKQVSEPRFPMSAGRRLGYDGGVQPYASSLRRVLVHQRTVSSERRPTREGRHHAVPVRRTMPARRWPARHSAGLEPFGVRFRALGNWPNPVGHGDRHGVHPSATTGSRASGYPRSRSWQRPSAVRGLADDLRCARRPAGDPGVDVELPARTLPHPGGWRPDGQRWPPCRSAPPYSAATSSSRPAPLLLVMGAPLVGGSVTRLGPRRCRMCRTAA